MFELCKRIDVYKIQNHYHYYYINGIPITTQKQQQNKFHMLKPKNGDSNITGRGKNEDRNIMRKGLELSKNMKRKVDKVQNAKICSPVEYLERAKYDMEQKILTAHTQICRSSYQAIYQSPMDKNEKLLLQLYDVSTQPLKTSRQVEKQDLSHIQRIQAKPKPTSRISYVTNPQSSKNPVLLKQVTSLQEPNLTFTKPASSKIETCCTVEMFASDRKSTKNQNDQYLNKSFCSRSEHSSSRFIISKSVSSVHESRLKSGQNLFDDLKRESNELSFNFSNIFSKEENINESDNKKIMKGSTLRRLSLWHDSDRHTIESKFSRQHDCLEDYSVKVEQSFIQDHDIRENLIILEQNRIHKKDYSISQAVDKKLDLVVSLKEFIKSEVKLLVQQLQAYQLLQNISLNNPELNTNILGLYQVQLNDNAHLLIKQPYTMPMQYKLRLLNPQQNVKLRQEAKSIFSNIMQVFGEHSLYPTRKVTIYEFVLCMDDLKFHDLSLFQFAKQPYLQTDHILAGLDI